MNKVLIYIICPFVIFSVAACDVLHFGGTSEGVIEFKISYPQADKKNIMIELYPSKMLFKLKDNNYLTEMSAGFGMFKTLYVSDFKEKKLTQLVNVLDKRYALTWDASNINDNWPKYEFETTNNTKEIAGYECQEVIVTPKNKDIEKFKVYYTDEIKREGKNWDNEFSGIDGFLMEYQMERYGVLMKFTATAIMGEDVSDNIFESPTEGYTFVSELEMNKIFENFK